MLGRNQKLTKGACLQALRARYRRQYAQQLNTVMVGIMVKVRMITILPYFAFARQQDTSSAICSHLIFDDFASRCEYVFAWGEGGRVGVIRCLCIWVLNINIKSNPNLPSHPNYYSFRATIQNGTPRCCSDVVWSFRHVVVLTTWLNMIIIITITGTGTISDDV